MFRTASRSTRIVRVTYNLYLEFRAIAARHDWLYRPMIAAVSVLRPAQEQLLVSRDTEIVIEGFPRSANTYLVAFLCVAQGRPVRIARHLHEAYQVRFAERHNIPCVVLFRQPLHAVVSALMRDTRTNPASVLRNYVRFYEEVLRVRKSAVMVPFELAVNNANCVIEKVNAVYGTSFSLLPQSALTRVARLVEAMDQEALKTTELDPLRIAAPSPEKSATKAQYESRVREHCRELLSKAEALYSQVARLGLTEKIPHCSAASERNRHQ